MIGGYQVHSMIDVGGRITEKSGSDAMWATMVNQTTGARILGQSLQMHSLDPFKTPFFDTLTTSSFGYGGDPYDATYLNMSKGKWYNFAGTFRRDRQYFDYNLLANSLLGPNQLIAQPSSLHLFNTVRRNTDTLLTLFPVSLVSFRAGYNHGTHEGPSYSTIHQGGDVQESQWFRNAQDTWVAGVDFKPFQRTTLSYDQFFAFYKGDTNYRLNPSCLSSSRWNAGFGGRQSADYIEMRYVGHSKLLRSDCERGDQSVLQRNHHGKPGRAHAHEFPDRAVSLCFEQRG